MNWVRLCAALDGFCVRYGHWPTRVRVPRGTLEDFRHLFTPHSLERLRERLDFVEAEHHFAAESDGGRRYDFMVEGFPRARPQPAAAVWLDLHPDAADAPPTALDGGGSWDPDTRYDLVLAGRRLYWLRPDEVIREVMRFMVYDLGFFPEKAEAYAGRPTFRKLPEGAIPESAGVGALSPRDPDPDWSPADVVRGGYPERFVMHSDDGWRSYREILYRLESLAPFGLISWKRSSLLSRQDLTTRLGLDDERAAGGRIPRRPYETPHPERHRPLANSYWVSAEHFLAGEYPYDRKEEEGRAKIDALLGGGVDCFIDLTDDREGMESYPRIASGSDPDSAPPVEYHWHPISPGRTPDVEELAFILDTIDDALQRRRIVYVHDRGGLGRSAMVVGCHLVRRGLTGEEALAKLSQLIRVMPKARSRPAPENEAQCRVIREWAARDPSMRT